MKKNKIYIYVLLSVIISVISYSCEPDDSEKKWGNTQVYMPQAAILDGGLTNNYPVPLGNNASTNNYKIDSRTNTLKIVLGVYRSGLQELEAFSVKVAADQTATATAVTNVTKGVELPSDVYALPAEASVAGGQRESIFYLDVDLNKLIDQYSAYAQKKLVLVVGVSDPTKYELNENLSKTTVIIDGASFMPAPKIVEGGNFESGSEHYWTFFNAVGNLPASVAIIQSGVLTFDYGADPIQGEICYYHAVELGNGVKYKFSCDFSSTGGASVDNCRFYSAVSPNLPVAGISYKYAVGSACYSILDAWNGLKNPVSGTLPQNGGWQERIDKSTGIFTSNFSGTGYVVIGVASWGSPIGKIIIDNVKIEEQ
jgi:hypothetical protein